MQLKLQIEIACAMATFHPGKLTSSKTINREIQT